MWDYTDKVWDHFNNPRNVGKIDDPDGVGEVGSLACGDALKFMFKLDDEGRIAQARFQTFGCASAIASASALTELVIGKTLDEAARITNQEIADALGGLPEQKMHCSVMGREALEAAIENHKTGSSPRKKAEGKVVCTCFGVTDREIERAVRENGLTTVDEVTHFTKAGGGCGGCRSEIDELLKTWSGSEVPPAEKPVKPMTNLQRIRLIEETLERQVRPLLNQDGGDLELVDVDGHRVIVSMRGKCRTCRVANVTLRDIVEPKLREFVSPDIVVVEES